MRIGIVLLVVVAAGAGAVAAWYGRLRTPEVTPAIRGKRLAAELGCFACHGPEGRGGVAEPTSPAGEVPAWDHGTAALFVSSKQDIRDWIIDGAPGSELDRWARYGRELLIPMPGYGDLLSAAELNDLVAYFIAVSSWSLEISEEIYQGREAARRLGCFGCHGPSAMGGVANPGSFTGYVPPWDGEEFARLVRDEAELRDWILRGRVERLWRSSVTRSHLGRQKILMPAYDAFLSDTELAALMKYIAWLRRDVPAERGGSGGPASVIGTIGGGR